MNIYQIIANEIKGMYLFATEGESVEAKLITFGGTAYPKYGQVLIMAGGAGSGKGFQLAKLIGLDGRVFDVDKFKELATSDSTETERGKKDAFWRYMLKQPKVIEYLNEHPEIDYNHLDLKKPKDVSVLHTLVKLSGIAKKQEELLKLNKDKKVKDNIIFDKTCKDEEDIRKVYDLVTEAGYQKENIHLVWVINSLDVAIEQNKSRARSVDEALLRATHAGVAKTMNELVMKTQGIEKYVGGDIWFSFNQAKVDVKLNNTKTVVNEACTVQIKKKGQPVDVAKFVTHMDGAIVNDLKKKVDLDKLSEYTQNPDWKK